MSQEDLAGDDASAGGEQHVEKATPVCPACGSKLTRRSKRRNWKERLKSFFGRWPFRCQVCSRRFTVHRDPEAIAKHNAAVEEALRLKDEEERKADEAAEEQFWEKP